jgi:hypothetical protein
MKNKLYLVLCLAALLLASLACNFSASTANISSAFMAKDQDGTQPTEVFTSDETFYCIVQLANAPDDTNLKAVWTAVNAENTDPNLQINETEITSGDGQVYFQLNNNSPWPTGDYKVDIYLNGTLNQTLNFSVQ